MFTPAKLAVLLCAFVSTAVVATPSPAVASNDLGPWFATTVTVSMGGGGPGEFQATVQLQVRRHDNGLYGNVPPGWSLTFKETGRDGRGGVSGRMIIDQNNGNKLDWVVHHRYGQVMLSYYHINSLYIGGVLVDNWADLSVEVVSAGETIAAY
ncbi:hypothetical protein E5Q_02434 [Mixia osmundae IAM 14324]|uniref:Lipocalin-like domain-containing protein n=2 Tax=Mixia osmundae (strain CBS 9802 / IAM 14324 / JCM 22182 / KY 12970) TaxID=764103 RepID=G7DYW7_MIXOS|nr:hypothetical protein E5Q_02434 [Mixia osmundae IAM 14324]